MSFSKLFPCEIVPDQLITQYNCVDQGVTMLLSDFMIGESERLIRRALGVLEKVRVY